MYFTKDHDWIQLEGKKAKIGLSDFAVQELGQIVHIEFPKIGSEVQEGSEVAVLESTKAAADLYAPVSGKIIAVNPLLAENPTIINQSPEEHGWIYQIELDSADILSSLLSLQEYKDLIQS